jgi:hypothetical protein
MNPWNYVHLIFDKVAKNIWWRKDSFFNKYFWENQISSCRKLKLDPCLSSCTSINSKWTQELHIISEILKLVQERTGNIICIGNDFLTRSQLAQQKRERIDKWDYMKLKSFCTTKDIVSKLKSLFT